MDRVKLATLQKYIDSLKDPEMKALAMVESSGGRNLEHPMVTKGLNAGYTAGGPWGLMPITAQDTLKKHPELSQHYPNFANLLKDPDTNKQAITDMLNNDPQLAYDVSKSRFNENRTKFPDLDSAVYSWYNGVNGAKKAMAHNPDTIPTSDYVQKFHDYYKPDRVPAQEQKPVISDDTNVMYEDLQRLLAKQNF